MILDKSKLSPMMRKYFEKKAEYPDTLLFFRLGDFYEMFFEDALTASKVLDLTLTGRDCGLDERAPMCGVPYHSVDNYIRRLIDSGYRVAICEQLSDPAASKGMVERDVVRVVTPGTLMEEDILDERSSNYLASVFTDKLGFGLAWADISTGEFNLFEYAGEDRFDRLCDLLGTFAPVEIICNEGFLNEYGALNYFRGSDVRPRCYGDYSYHFATAAKKLCAALGVASLDSFECADKTRAVAAAGGLYEYLIKTQKRALSQINKLTFIRDKAFMTLDAATRRNLELTARARDGKRVGSLLYVLDKTVTPMGARNLRRWLEQPLQDEKAINVRLNAVEALVGSKAARERLTEALSGVRDLERLSARLAFGSATPRDLLAISDTLSAVPDVKAALKGIDSPLIKTLLSFAEAFPDINSVLIGALNREMPGNFKNGGYIKTGYNEALDQMRNIKEAADVWLANLESNERESTGIKNLRVGYNRVFGYYIEVSKSFSDKVPYRYQRKQTLVGGERYITEELKQIEERVLSASGDALALEERILAELKTMLTDKLTGLQTTGRALAEIDTLLSFAVVAVRNGYVKPKISAKIKAVEISEGRHPVVETLLDRGAYVPNDTTLDGAENRTMVITGPNMAGKSTYMRQVALIVLMAHIGSFVPAKSAEIALTDRIFTRIGASDDLSGGQSTFMVEMIEVATILNYATEKSLLILDEIGRGTSTYDGLSIAWAVLEYITLTIRAKTLFATHFHELTEIEELGGVKNYRILVSEQSDKIVFLHKIARGSAPRSFGIEVASLAGVKKPVIEQAKRIMRQLESVSKTRDTNEILIAARPGAKTAQVSLFDVGKSDIERELEELDVDNLTPMQALTVLGDLKKRLSED